MSAAERKALEAAREAVEREHGPGFDAVVETAIAALSAPQVGAEAVAKALNDDQIMEIIKEVAPWKDEPKLNDLLTYEKSPPLFPQATYDVPSYRAVNFVRAVERRILSALDHIPDAGNMVAPPASVAETDDDETYKIGLRDGYESAIQELDLATGGDGEFRGSTFPGETVDIPAMRQRVIDRLQTPAPVDGAIEALRAAQERFAQIDCARLTSIITNPGVLIDYCKAIASQGFDEASRALAALRSTGPSVPASEPNFARSIAEVIKEESDSGAAAGWRSCTGCHETNEGYETGHYPYSKMFGCYVGSGCSECGGIGVTWEYWSENVLKTMQEENESTASPIDIPTPPATGQSGVTEANWRDDPSADERWCAGLDYGQTQLCNVLGVDPATIDWDAATETLDGDVQSVIGKILAARFGDDWITAAIGTPSGWRSMDSAPKDGREVLLYLRAPFSRVEKARWYEPWGNWQCGTIPADPAREEYCGIGAAVPTHWMPLPSAPEGGEPAHD